MDASELSFVLEDLSFSAPLASDVINHIAAKATLRQVPAGKSLFREGQKNDELFLVRSGRIALDMTVPGRGAVRILTLGPGEMVGWSALVGPDVMTTSAVAIEDSELVAVPARQLLAECESNPVVGYNVMQRMAKALSRRLVLTRLQLLDLFAESPQQVPAVNSQDDSQ